MRCLTAALIALVVVLMAPGRAGAAGSDPALEARIEGGFDGFVVPGRPAPVRVTLTAGELRSGELTVALGNGPEEVVGFEISGGSSEEHWVLLDLPTADISMVSVTARVGGRNVDLGQVNLEYAPDSHLIGTLDGLGGIEPGDVETRVGGQRIHAVDLEPGVLDLGPNALGALDSIAVTPDDVAGLSDTRRDAILGWLELGGTLYVDSAPGGLANWPDGLQPTATIVRDGAATVIATDGALAAGRWSEVVLPGPSRSIREDGVVAQALPSSDPRAELFGVDLGRDLPSLSELLGILALYTILVGPVAYVAFRRRVMGRWVAIPALALVATGVLFVRGGGPGVESTASVVDVIQTGAGPAMATTRVVLSTDVGEQHLVAPAGWSARAEDSLGFVPGPRVQQRRGIDGVEVSIPAQAGGVGTVSAQGPVAFDGALEVTAAAASDGTVSGSVRNTTGFTLDEVAVFFARTTATQVGSLEPGATAEFTLTGTNQTTADIGFDILQATWPGDSSSTTFGAFPVGPMGPTATVFSSETGVSGQIIMGASDGMGVRCDESGNCFPVGVTSSCFGTGCASGPARPSSLGSALRPRGTNAMSYGIVTAVGWATDVEPVVDLGSDVDVVDSHTAIVGRAVPTVPGDRLVDSGSVRQIVSASTNLGNSIEITFSQDLPVDVGGRPVDPDRLRLHMPLAFNRVEILTPDGPRLVRDIDPNDPGDETEELVVPPDAVAGGRVLYRVSLRPTPPPPGLDMLIYEAAP